MKKRVLLNVGCGAVRPPNWINTDSSMNALIQKIPFGGKSLAKKIIKSSVYASDNVKYMNLNKYWKFDDESVDIVYASHIFEHLSEKATKIFLIESLRVLKVGGVLRLAIPDLYKLSKKYLNGYEKKEEIASHDFMHSLNLHQRQNDKASIKTRLNRIINWLQGYPHLHKYMYDQYSLEKILHLNGFKNIKIMEAGKSDGIVEINDVEANRDTDISLYVECNK
jgi:predicted SAM-dependent methyltransferase